MGMKKKVKKYAFFRFLVYFFDTLNDEQRYKICRYIIKLKMLDYGYKKGDLFLKFYVHHPQMFFRVAKNHAPKDKTNTINNTK